tara:strand:- start:83 stop:1306 length:1224 start_codon:yes stop_codon:yes gene_type:complete
MADGAIDPNSNPIAVLLKLLSKNSGVTVPADLRQEIMRLISGTYTTKGALSEDQVYATEAPNLIKIATSEPEGSLRKKAASLILKGVSPWSVQEQIRADMAADPTLMGMMTDKEWNSFIDQLSTENDKAQKKLFEESQKQDYFQKQGFPGVGQQYTTEDIINMAPETFSKLATQAEAGRPAYDKRVADIQSKFGATPMMKAPTEQEIKTQKSIKDDKKVKKTLDDMFALQSISASSRLTPMQIQFPDKTDAKQVAANKAYLKLLKPVASYESKTTSDTGDSGSKKFGKNALLSLVTGGLGPPLLGLKKGVESVFGAGAPLGAYKAPEKSVAEQPMIVDPILAARQKAWRDAAIAKAGRQQGMPAYYENAAAKLASNIEQKATQSGRNPLVDALIRDLLTKKAYTGGK